MTSSILLIGQGKQGAIHDKSGQLMAAFVEMSLSRMIFMLF